MLKFVAIVLGVIILLAFAILPMDPQLKTVGVLVGVALIAIGRILMEFKEPQGKET